MAAVLLIAGAVSPVLGQATFDEDSDEIVWGTSLQPGFSQNNVDGTSANILAFQPAIA